MALGSPLMKSLHRTEHARRDVGVILFTGYFTVRHSDRIEPSTINTSKDWNFKKGDYEALYNMISGVSWDGLYQIKDAYESVKYFYSIIYSMFDAFIPKKRRNGASTSRYPVWFTRDIINDIKIKLKLHRSWKRTKSKNAYHLFSDLRSDLKSRITVAYESHLATIEQNIRIDPRQFWRHVSSLRSKGGFEPKVEYKGNTVSGVKAAEAFAEFFSSVFLPDVPNLDHTGIQEFPHLSSRYVGICEITSRDVEMGIRKLKLGSSIGPDSIPPWLLKENETSFTEPLKHMFNIALKLGHYPSQWKTSRVTPIPKSSNKLCVEEHRPIAILSTLAKVFEHILHAKIYKQVEPFLCNEQHGFRRKRSVDTNLLIITDYISSRLDQGIQVDVLYFDFRKAFDRVNNDKLLEKLSALGLSPSILRFIADYLRDRQQYVRHGLYESQPYHTRSGVSQGSILGPLLFILMINDLPTIVKYAKCLLYADDIKLFFEIKSQEDCVLLQHDIDSIYRWSIENKLEFNPAKCFQMSFGRKRCPIAFDYKLGSGAILKVSTIKDLGVTFDRKLTFHDHMITIAKESFQRLGFVLRNSQDFHNINVMKLLFGALVRSKLEASACVWHPYESTYALLLEKVQKAFLRYLYKRVHTYYPLMYPTKYLLGCLGYNSLEVRRWKDQLVIMCKILRGMVDAPDLNSELCRLFVPNNYCRGRKHRLFAVPTCRTVARARSPIPRTLTTLNALLDSAPHFDIFTDEWKVILSECLCFCELNA